MKTILVPLDGSRRAEAILEPITNLAQSRQAKVVLLYVIESYLLYANPIAIFSPIFEQEAFDQETKDVRGYLAAQQRKLREKGIDIQTRWTYGRAADEIIRVAEYEKADLIAMTSPRRSGLAQILFGSVAAKVLHRVNRPVLLIQAAGDN